MRDRDLETGKRFLRLSDSARDWQKAGRPLEAPVQWIRERWEHYANEALERAGHEARIDRRTLEAQGIDREPTIHIGPRAQHIDRNKSRPESQERPERSWRRTQYRDHVPYPAIDLGRTRNERNAEIIDLNLERAARSPDFETRKWAEFEKEQAFLDRNLERQLTAQARRHTLDEEQVRGRVREQRHDMKQRRADEQEAVLLTVERRRELLKGKLAEKHQEERSTLHASQSGFLARFMRAVDVTGRTRKRQDNDSARLEVEQAKEGARLEREIRSMRVAQLKAVRARYTAELLDLRAERAHALRSVAEKHAEEKAQAERLIQEREQAREAARLETSERISAWKRQAREAAREKKVAGDESRVSSPTSQSFT